MITETQRTRIARLLDAANHARLKGDHAFANVFIALISVHTDTARSELAEAQKKRQRVKDSFSANPFSA